MTSRPDDIQLKYSHEEVRSVLCSWCHAAIGEYCGIRGQKMRKQFCHIERFKEYQEYVNTPMYDTKKFN